MAAEGEFPKTDGDVLYGSEVNAFQYKGIQQVYTGSTADVTFSAGTGSTTGTAIELDAVSSSVSKYASYIKFTNLFRARASLGSSEQGFIDFKLEIKEIGGSYSTIYDFRDDSTSVFADFASSGYTTYKQMSWVQGYALTSGMKTNGFQVKFTAKCGWIQGGALTMNYTNEQMILEVL